MDVLVNNIAKKKHKKKNVKKKQPKTPSEKPIKHNTKAFTFSGGRRSVHRRVQHASEVEEKLLRRPRIFKTPEVPPPIVVVVQGPKNVGKSTLITSLVKQYSKRNITNINGPITLVSSKSRRLTLIECGNSMLDMIDCCKIADIAIVMIDGSYGFEMETFEFVNMMQVHGFPRVIGVLTHLDSFKDNKTLRKTKKILKKRFWSEIYDGAKMFYLTGLQYERYKKNEILNLSRYISSQKPPIISWRLTHPYIISLRHEIIETQDNLCKISFYGYVYGGKLNISNGVHIPGAGDFKINSITNFQDPCQIQSKDRTLKDKNRNIYSPYCDVGSLVLDDDAMYIQLYKTKEHFTEMPDEDKNNISEAVQMVRTLQKLENFEPNQVKLNILNTPNYDRTNINNKKNIKDKSETNVVNSSEGEDIDSDEEYDSSDDEEESEDIEYTEDNDKRDIEDIEDNEEDDEETDKVTDLESQFEDETDTEDFDDVEEQVDSSYDTNIDEISDEEVIEDSNVFKNWIYKNEDTLTDHTYLEDSTEDSDDDSSTIDDDTSTYEDDDLNNEIDIYDDISQRVYFGDSKCENLDLKDFSKVFNDDLNLNWDDDKLRLLRELKFQNLSDNVEEEDDDKQDIENDPDSEKFRKIQEEEKKKLFQETLELDYNGNIGNFVKICISGIPLSFIDSLDISSRPIIIGSIQQSEQGCGFMQLKLKRHRWFPKILKTNDPLLFSVGWRRFQSLPIYCMEDRNQSRIKMLKYTPEHLHCLANIYGPLSPPNFGILAIKNWERMSNYRISASGVIVGTNQNYKIMKKLKFIGEPYKIMKNTCFIKNMFNSELEVIKCIGSKIQTVSGIRGQIKKPIDKNGAFRATFEDKILLSDLVLLKSWINVETKQFYNLILDSDKFKRIKSISELKKYDYNKPDSKYERKELIRRPVHKFNEIKIPKPIIEKLPFSSKPKVIDYNKPDLNINLEPSKYEKKISKMLQKLQTIRKERINKRKEIIKQYKLKKITRN